MMLRSSRYAPTHDQESASSPSWFAWFLEVIRTDCPQVLDDLWTEADVDHPYAFLDERTCFADPSSQEPV